MDHVRGSVLVVDDEPTIGEVVSKYLERAGYETRLAADGYEAIEAVAQRRPDLIVLDLMLPGIDGLEVRRRVRDRSTAIILLTAKGEESDRVIGLRLGADDYVVKPFSPAELVARVDAVLRRVDTVPERAPTLRFGDLEVDPGARQARRDGEAGAPGGPAPGAHRPAERASRSPSPRASSTCCSSSPATLARRSRARS